MSGMPDPYSRFYWRFKGEFPDIYADKEAFGWWMTLLAAAEGAHPSAPEMPRRIKSRILQALIDAGLLTLLPNDCYRIRGVSAEMTRRSEKGKAGAEARWQKQSEGNASGNANALRSQSLDKTRQDEQSKDKTSTTALAPVERKNGPEKIAAILPDATTPNADVGRLQKLAEDLTQQPYVMANVHSGFGLKAVSEQLNRHGFDRTEGAWRQIANRAKAEGKSQPTLKQLVLGADDILNPVPRQNPKDTRQEDEAAAFDRRVARTQAELASLRGQA